MPSSTPTNRPEDLIARLGSADGEAKLKSLRELKNQIIGNRTKKLSYAKLGAVPAVVSILATAIDGGDSSLILQSAATIGSFACGVDAGVRAVLNSGAISLLLQLLSHSNDKILDAGARSLKMIYQSKLAPKYDFLQKENSSFVYSLLNGENENVTGLGASIISHSCQTTADQKVLCEAGVLRKLQNLLEGSINQRDASLEALAMIMKNNDEVISEFVEADGGKTLQVVTELIRDKFPRTRLLACMCLAEIWNISPGHVQDAVLRTKLIYTLLELLDEHNQVGDEAPFALVNLLLQEDIQKLAFETGAIEKLCFHLQKDQLQVKRFRGVLLALAELCSKLEICRSRLMSLQVLKFIIDALSHDSSEVRNAACICLRSVSRSVKSLSAGRFMNETTLIPLLRLLNDSSLDVQIAALNTISNVVVDFASHKSTFVQCGGVKQLVQLSKSMDSDIRLHAVRALRNLIFLTDYRAKLGIFSELTTSTLSSLISDSDPSVQEQALGFVCNLVDGCADSIEFVFFEDALLLSNIGRQLHNSSKVEICIQGMYALANIAAGNDCQKEATMDLLIPLSSQGQFTIINFLQSNDNSLRTATVWFVVNLIMPCNTAACSRVVRIRDAGIYSQIKSMVCDSCLDVKLRVKTALQLFYMIDKDC
ncbi:hypothetical protein V2J09_018497 [Rumex salicifolius]